MSVAWRRRALSFLSWSVAGAVIWHGLLAPVVDTLAFRDRVREIDATVVGRTASDPDPATLRAETERLRTAIEQLFTGPVEKEVLRAGLASRLDSADAILVEFKAPDWRSGASNVISADVIYRLRAGDLERSIRALADGPLGLTIRSLDVRRAAPDETVADELVVELGVFVLTGSGGEE